MRKYSDWYKFRSLVFQKDSQLSFWVLRIGEYRCILKIDAQTMRTWKSGFSSTDNFYCPPNMKHPHPSYFMKDCPFPFLWNTTPFPSPPSLYERPPFPGVFPQFFFSYPPQPKLYVKPPCPCVWSSTAIFASGGHIGRFQLTHKSTFRRIFYGCRNVDGKIFRKQTYDVSWHLPQISWANCYNFLRYENSKDIFVYPHSKAQIRKKSQWNFICNKWTLR